MSLNQKILALLQEKHMTKAQLSKAAGIPYTTLDSMLKRDSDSKRLASFFRIARHLGVPVEELVFDGDEPFAATPSLSAAERELLSNFRLIDRRGKGVVLAALSHELHQKEQRAHKVQLHERRIPVYDFPAAAGAALPVLSEDYSLQKATNVPQEASFGIRIAGDSMEPLIDNNSIVWVRKQEALADGDVGIFMLNGESLCKRLSQANGACRLLSVNPKYAPISILETDDLRVIGKVLFA